VWHLREIYSGLPWAILGRLIPRLSVVVICISGAVAGRLRPGHGGRVVVIEDGVDIEFFSPGHGDHPDATVTMVARLHPLKGHRLFIEAAAQVASEEPRARFLVAGNIRPIWQPLLDDLHVRAQQLGVADRLEFLGHVDRAVLPALFARSTMAVVPSTWPEGGGLVVLEAMACGLPVIATNLGGPAEIITNGVDGILVSATDSGELATAISKLLSRAQLRRRLGTAGRKRVLSKYSEQVQADRVVGVYETVLEHRPAVSKAPDGRRTDPTDADR
jgi:glycosyltransferase involved in cell wall biosynthesis